VKTVCCFGAYDPAYPRNRMIRAGLSAAGFGVVEARAPAKRAWRRWPALAAAWSRVAKRTDLLLVPEFRHKDVPLARALKGARPLVFDPLVSRWDTLVEDWRLHAEGSAQARWNRSIDRWAFRSADRLLCDTWAHGELFVTLGADRSRLRRVLVGAEPAFFDVPPPPAQGPVRLTYIGGFLPLHGISTLLEGVARLEARASANGSPLFPVLRTTTSLSRFTFVPDRASNHQRFQARQLRTEQGTSQAIGAPGRGFRPPTRPCCWIVGRMYDVPRS